MRRTTIVLAAVASVAVVALSAPYWMGVRTEREVRDLARRTAQDSGLQVQILSYRRGWFSSRARIRISLVPPSNSAQGFPRISFDLDERIDHGPYPPLDLARGTSRWAPVQAVIHSAWVGFDGKRFADMPGLPAQPLQALVVIGLSGAGDTTVRMPAWRLHHPGVGVTGVVWGGLQGRARWSRDLAHVRQRFTAAGLEVDAPKGFVKLRGVSLQGRSHRAPSGLMQGSMALRAASLQARFDNHGAPTEAGLTDLSLHSASTEHDGLVDMGFATRVKTIRVGTLVLGPFDYELHLRRVDAGALVRLRQAIRGLRGHAASPAAARQAFRQALLQELPQLLRRSPEFVLDRLSLDTPEGVVSLRGRARFPASLVAGPNWWQNITAQAELHVPQVLLRGFLVRQARVQLAAARRKGAVQGLEPEQVGRLAGLMASQRLQALKTRGLLQCAGGQCRSALELDSGRVSVNGRTLTPGEHPQ